MRRTIWLVVVVWLGACRPLAPPPPPVVEPAPLPADGDEATQVCAQWRRLGCEESTDTASGASCEDVVRNSEREGIDLTPPLDCMSLARDCDEMRQCES